MAEPPQEGSIARREDAGGPPERRSVLSRLGLGKEPSERAPYLRAILAGVKEAGAKQLEQLPVLGPLLSGVGEALLELSAEEDDAVFEERLAEILDTGRQSRETLEALGALSSAIYLQQNVLLSRLEAMGLPAQREQLTGVALSTALAAYRGRVARDYQYADHRGIEGVTRAEHTASLPLDEVYVLPRLVPERDRFESRERESQLLKDLLDNEDLPPAERAKREEEFALLTGERWCAGKEKAPGKTIGEALASTRHAVVIGSPGVGKSAMTRFLARTCALGEEVMREKLGWAEELTPVVLPLAAYADARSRQSGLTLQKHLESWLEERGGKALREAVCEELRAGRVLILFDGVDEIPDSRERVLVVRAVEGFLADHGPNRFLVTSRPYGYVRLAGEISHFQLPNFSPEQVEEFVRRWQRAFERWRHPEAPDLTQADQQAREMLEEIRRNPKVEELATNPLMLVIFALIRHEQARLPEERVQLYNRAVNTLMDSWNRGRCLAGIDVGGARLPLDRLVRVWSAVAEWTRRTKPTGVVHRAELKTKLIQILRNEELDEDAPEATADSYLNAAADRAGLLEERGKDIFAFWHPTFEEFLAAVELTTPSSHAIKRILPLRGDPRWREVILLAVGYLGVVQRDRETATELVRAIWKVSPSPLEPLLHSHLRLAAACVADDVGVKRSLAEEVILDCGEVVSDLPYPIFVDSFAQAVRGLPRLRPSNAAVEKLIGLKSHKAWKVRMESARLLSNVALESADAFHTCKRLLRDSDPDVRCHAAFGLLQAGQNSLEAWAALAGFESRHAEIRKPVEEWLSKVSFSRAAASLKSLLTNSNEELRWRAVDVLSRVGGDPALLLSALEPFLTGSNEEQRLRAALVLSRVGGYPGLVFSALEPLLTSPKEELRWRAAEALRVRGDRALVLSTLKPLLASPNEELRLRAADVMSRVGGDPALVLSSLAPFLASSNEESRLRAADALSRVGSYPVLVLSALEPLLTSPNEELCWRAASVLSQVQGDTALVLSALEPWLTGSNQELRWRAAAVLSRLGGDLALVMPALDSWLTDLDEEGIWRAVSMLSVGRDPGLVSSVLKPWLTGTDRNLRWRAAEMLSRVRGDPTLILSALEPFLTDSDREVRWSVAEVLSRIGSDPTLILSVLEPWLTGLDGVIHWKAAELALELNSPAAVELLVKLIEPNPWLALACCQKVLSQQSISEDDGKTLAVLVQEKPEDTEKQRKARFNLFHWLYARLEPGASACPAA